MDSNRKIWNRAQKRLRALLDQNLPPEHVFDLFYDQHAVLHSKRMGASVAWSFEDEILNDLEDLHFRQVPAQHSHSIAWLLWHMARIEDVTMSMLVAGEPQLLNEGVWITDLGIESVDTGNAMSADEIQVLSQTIHIEHLREYRCAVGKRTVDIVRKLIPQQLKNKVDAVRIQHIAEVGAVKADAFGVLDYWSRRTIGGLLLMPATRHNLIHLNEAERVKADLT
jgi:hypothetical protein